MDGSLSLPLRLAILAAGILLWTILFFVVKQIKTRRSRLDMITSLDRRIPFQPGWALVYFSTYVFIFLPFLALPGVRQFFALLAGYAIVTVYSTLFYVLLPSQVQRVENLPTDNLSGKMLAFFQGFSKPYDNFPSMHVAFSVLAVGASYAVLGPLAGSLALAWAALIALSTLFTKQHYLLDVLGGVIGGTLTFLAVVQFVM